MEPIADFFTHLGWALWGQECDCGHNPFNGLARRMAKLLPERDWNHITDNYDHRWQRAIYRVGQWFYDLGCWLYWPPEHTD